jgi:hypothetical protein
MLGAVTGVRSVVRWAPDALLRRGGNADMLCAELAAGMTLPKGAVCDETVALCFLLLKVPCAPAIVCVLGGLTPFHSGGCAAAQALCADEDAPDGGAGDRAGT